MYGISIRCILDMLDGETESTFGDIAKGAGLRCLEGGLFEKRMSTLSMDRGLFVSWALDGRGSA